MLKKTWILFLGLVVCIGSACVTPTHASSALHGSVVLAHIQAASTASPKAEMVVVYNNTATAVNVSNWCVKNKSNVEFVCFTPYSTTVDYYLAPYSYAVAATESFFESSPVYPEDVSFIYPVTNQSSGSIVNSNDAISLIDSTKQVVDAYSWTSPIPASKILSRYKSLGIDYLYETSPLLTNWFYESLPTIPISTIDVVDIPEPTNPTIPPESEVPIDPPSAPPIQSEHQLRIVEFLSNPVGTDTGGNEFIEIYNPNNTVISLSNYRLRVGLNLEKLHSFPTDATIAPYEYKAFTNQDIKFTLVNTSSVLQLERVGQLVDDSISYTSPPEGFAYAEYGGSWYYTATPTPGSANIITINIPGEDDESLNPEDLPSTVSTLKSCAANQYRHPETNRCRNNVSAAASSLTPCASTQYRSPETNRCRNISTSSVTPTACKVGQERNPETNRCRNVVAMSTADHGIKGVSTENSHTGAQWYWWLGVGGVVALVLGYAVWEWREELRKWVRFVRSKFARKAQ